MPYPFVNKSIRHILLWCEMTGIVMRVEITVMIAQLLHELRRRIANRKRNRLVASPSDKFQGSINT